LVRQVVRVMYSFSSKTLIKKRFCEDDMLRYIVEKLSSQCADPACLNCLNIHRDTAGILANVVIGDAETKRRVVVKFGGLDPLVKLLRTCCGPDRVPGTEDI